MSLVSNEFLANVRVKGTYVYDTNKVEIGRVGDYFEIQFTNADHEVISLELSESDVETLMSLWSADTEEQPVYSDGRVYWYVDYDLVVTEQNGDLVLGITTSTLEFQSFFDSLTEALWLMEKGELDRL